MPQWLTPTIIAGVLGIAGAWITARFGKKGERENLLIDQLQEQITTEREQRQTEVKSLTDRLADLQADVDTLRRELNSARAREVQWEIHCTRLEVQVETLGGKPRERPLVLTRQEDR